MKKLLLLFSFFTIVLSYSQIVNIPDANFKNALLNHNPVIDTNGDGKIQVSEAELVTDLNVSYKNIHNLTGIEAFTSLSSLNCSRNSITSINLSNNNALVYFDCFFNYLTVLDVSMNPLLTYINCQTNYLTTIDISQNLNLLELHIPYNDINTLDLTQNTNLEVLNCSNNNLTELDLVNNTLLEYLDCSSNLITELYINQNLSLSKLYCGYNNLENLDVSNLTGLKSFICHSNMLTSLDLRNNSNLKILSCSSNELTELLLDTSTEREMISIFCNNNQLTTLDLSNITFTEPNAEGIICDNNSLTNLILNNTDARRIYCHENQLTDLNLSDVSSLEYLICKNNLDLNYINLKNGNNDIISQYSDFTNLPILKTVCLDEINSDLATYIADDVAHPVTFTEYCSLTPALHNKINGIAKYDVDANGCDTSDIALSGVMVVSDNTLGSSATFTQNDGSYLIYTDEGDFTTSLTTGFPSYFTSNPNSHNNTFAGYDNTFSANFCLEANQTVNDVSISLLPIIPARPGFEATYQMVYKNVGTTPLNGDVFLNFDESMISFTSASETPASQTANSLTFNYTSLKPFETRTIDVVFQVFTPPTVEIGNILSFSTTINPIADDYTIGDNTFELHQTVVGSYDPNDIICLEGEQVLLENKDDYLHYLIRFQNTGTASATNVVVANLLDEKLDYTTLQLESLSHNNRVAITNGNEIEFIFENINLPDSTTDNLNSHGYIAYKVKPISTVNIGDVIPNTANIFFDYNEAVETNIYNTEIVESLSIREHNSLDFSVFPSPTKDVLNIQSDKNIIDVKIYNQLGQTVKISNLKTIDISNFNQGIYFVKVIDENGNIGIQKVIKE